MKVHLMYPDRSFQPDLENVPHASALIADLGLDTMIAAMGNGDQYLSKMAHAALLQPLTDPGEIRYRQQVLTDCARQSDVITRMYDIATEAIEVDKHILLGWHSEKPTIRLYRSRSGLIEFVKLLRLLRTEADEHSSEFTSPGLLELFASMQHELPDAYLNELDNYLNILEFPVGVQESVRLGRANEGTEYVLRTPSHARPSILEILTPERSRHTVTVAERDVAGTNSLVAMKEHGFAVTAEALVQSANHVKGYFTALRQELGFFRACLNLRSTLTDAEQPLCLPQVHGLEHTGFSASGLYEPLLVVHGERHPVGSDVDADGSQLVVITGANQGGKSTFLRALGLAQLMMQSGMFVAAEEFSAGVVNRVFTHFKREEDQTMVRGKFDEELSRMSTIVESISPGALVLLNESFSATNEREAAAVGAEVVEGLLDCGIQVRLVTHLYDFAERLRRDVASSVFLRAERLEGGVRSHQVVPGEPLHTSYGADLYEQIFGHALS